MTEHSWQASQEARNTRRERRMARWERIQKWQSEQEQKQRNADSCIFAIGIQHGISKFKPEDKIQQWLGHKRRAHRIGTAQGLHSEAQWISRVDYFGWLCRYCGIKLTRETLVKEHQLPVAKGGSNWPSNLVPSCQQCNSKKHTKHPVVFMLEMRFNSAKVLSLP